MVECVAVMRKKATSCHHRRQDHRRGPETKILRSRDPRRIECRHREQSAPRRYQTRGGGQGEKGATKKRRQPDQVRRQCLCPHQQEWRPHRHPFVEHSGSRTSRQKVVKDPFPGADARISGKAMGIGGLQGHKNTSQSCFRLVSVNHVGIRPPSSPAIPWPVKKVSPGPGFGTVRKGGFTEPSPCQQ